MQRDSKAGMVGEEGVEFGPDTIEQVMRERVRATIEAIVEEDELSDLDVVVIKRTAQPFLYLGARRAALFTHSLVDNDPSGGKEGRCPPWTLGRYSRTEASLSILYWKRVMYKAEGRAKSETGLKTVTSLRLSVSIIPLFSFFPRS